MVYALMFDNYQNRVRDDQWCVSRSGSIEFCRGYVKLTDDHVPWAKSDFGNRVKREDHSVGGEPGAIYELNPVANFAANVDDMAFRHLDGPEQWRATSIGWIMGGFLARIVVGVLLHGRARNAILGDGR